MILYFKIIGKHPKTIHKIVIPENQIGDDRVLGVVMEETKNLCWSYRKNVYIMASNNNVMARATYNPFRYSNLGFLKQNLLSEVENK